MEAGRTSATVALACIVLNSFSDRKDWKPADFMPSAAVESRREMSWQQQKEMMMIAFPPPPGYPKRYIHLDDKL